MRERRSGGPARPVGRYGGALIGWVMPAGLVVWLMGKAWKLTIDDAYISFRCARNLARGEGLVFNPGERVEAYTDFLWTVTLAAVTRLGGDPVVASKVLGALSAVGIVWLTYRLSARLLPRARVPCLAPWMVASSFSLAGHAVFGLETALFSFLVLAGYYLVWTEVIEPRRFPWSGLVFAAAFLTRPEAPLYFGVATLLAAWGRRLIARQNLLRVGVFFVVGGAYVAWRRVYYGRWLPNTLLAKTGNLDHQLRAGKAYLQNYATDVSVLLALALAGAVVLFMRGRRRESVALTIIPLLVAAYVLVVGGDWMPLNRFMVPVEPLYFVLAAVALRAGAEAGNTTLAPVLAAIALLLAGQRVSALASQLDVVGAQKKHWDSTAKAVAQWLVRRPRGLVAVGDMGFISYKTDYPMLDLLGLADPAVSGIPGGYGLRTGPAFRDHVFGSAPRYIVIVAIEHGCTRTLHPTFTTLFQESQARLMNQYHVGYRVNLARGWGWCIYERNDDSLRRNARLLFDFEGPNYEPWVAEGQAFAAGPQVPTAPTHQPVIGQFGNRFCTSFDPVVGDVVRGVLTSPGFLIDRDFLSLRVGGGRGRDTRVEFWVDRDRKKVLHGEESEMLVPVTVDTRPWRGREAYLRVVDDDVGPWGHILLDHVELVDLVPSPPPDRRRSP